MCRPGYERLTEDFDTCSKFKPGFFHADHFARTCSACATDTYQPSPAALECLSCPSDSTTLNRTGTPAIEHCVCNPGFENLVEGACQQCAAGKFRTHRVANVENGAAAVAGSGTIGFAPKGSPFSLAAAYARASSVVGATKDERDTSGARGYSAPPSSGSRPESSESSASTGSAS